ncbi:hypothetical protein KRR23_05660 [Pseudomonas sp. CVAP|uniref:Acb2/Tad1 domain-containing protein n=1 Tax=Pseudomonas sp. CVAP\|nr:hypothetical protein [Pseudomonas sp. CVAP\
MAFASLNLTQSEIDGMNSIKALEADAGELFKQIGQIEGVDPRLLALAKTNLQQGFMWFVRSIAKPADPFSCWVTLHGSVTLYR